MKDFYTAFFQVRHSKKYVNEGKMFSSYFITFPGGGKIELMHQPGIKDDKKADENRIGLAHFAISVGRKVRVDELSRKLVRDGVILKGKPRLTGDGFYEAVFF